MVLVRCQYGHGTSVYMVLLPVGPSLLRYSSSGTGTGTVNKLKCTDTIPVPYYCKLVEFETPKWYLVYYMIQQTITKISLFNT